MPKSWQSATEVIKSWILDLDQNLDYFIKLTRGSAFLKSELDSFLINLSFLDRCGGKRNYHKETGISNVI